MEVLICIIILGGGFKLGIEEVVGDIMDKEVMFFELNFVND